MLAAIQTDVDLTALTTLGVPARAAFFCKAGSVDEIRDALAWADSKGVPVQILGGGSNVVFAADFAGLVLQPALPGRAHVGETTNAHLVQVGAGERWHDTVSWTLQHGWPGLENLALIPGSVGAAPIQNIGAYGLELTDRFHELEAFDRTTGESVALDREACRFGYRDSVFKRHPRDRWIVLSVTFALPRAWTPQASYRDLAEELLARKIAEPSAQDVFDAVVAVRQRKLPDPAEVGNVGSFFKNPLVDAATWQRLASAFPGLVSYPQADGHFKLAAGWLIDQAGWKGRSLGHARVHPNQALVLTNAGGATGKEILALADAIAEDVARRFDIQLEAEPIVIGKPASD
ncbi:UDP-N-acetylmuramate dehydrogenase [Niveibacterium umoris]|uniref:UDP-N-acetylenolpyruvoylglucosamine reductase n=1 Tax=Niveibacterium umoris TaxID=1193620 RepID=A0A840BGB1_9RHOO|nr:UDP-N-acetylmuramate dehydrogenase [Niveibacterium umoris]MBB4012215.1 UDP-N-acetylmuramate dehydrogenase [Niveibacterium umoris]